MNIVKGVAELIRRTHSSQAGDSTTSSPAERLPPPSPRICFSDGGEEAVLSILWNRYENAGEKADKKRLFHVFLKQFLTVFRNWEPAYGGQLLEAGSTTSPSSDYMSCTGDMVVGCLAGHPAEIILALTEEIRQLTGLFSEFDGSTGRSTKDLSAGSIILIITSEGLPVLDALTIVTRSMHNCRVFGYYSGVQKITALMKGAVIQLKTLTSTLSNDGTFSNLVPEKTQLLHQVLSSVVSIVCSFMDLNLDVYKKAQLYNNSKEFSLAGTVHLNQFSKSSKDPLFETRLQWHRKAVISVMEAGGLNWLVELLRVIRRLSLKEKWMDMSLQYLTLGSLLLALCDNPRGQNHFKSIGGLEVLLDGLGLPSSNFLLLENAAHIVAGRADYPLEKYFVLHLLSLEVLREAVFGNLINLQFLCENGRVDKFANSFCSPAFLLQEYKKKLVVSSSPSDSQMSSSSLKDDKNVNICKAEASTLSSQSDSSTQFWSDYVTELSRVLCSFLPGPEDIVSHCSEVAVTRISMPAYVELSIRWVMRVLLTVFPCIKACSGEHELPSNLRMFASVLQHSALEAWSKLLISSPVLIEVLRKEGIWDLIFSEKFFYFGPSVELSQDIHMWTDNSFERPDTCSLGRNEVSSSGVDILQMEVISFVELAAVSSESNHNLPESSALLDALEQSACSPEIAHALVKSLLRILQLSTEKTVASFKALNAVSRVLKVGCIQAQEAKHSEISDRTSVANYHKSDLPEVVQSWPKCMQACMELFVEFWSLVDGARNLVLHDSTCIDCLFDLFWEESLRNNVLSYILDLMKIVPSSEEDRRAKLLVCSKYLELFTRMKELDQRFEVLSVDLLVSMRDMLQSDPVHYQALFRDGECFLHVVSLLNCNLDEAKGEKLALNVLKTLTYLLSGNDASKAAFRGLVGKGYQTLQSLLLNFCQWHPSKELLNALLDMLVDGHFEINKGPLIKNEDVIILYLCVLQKSSESLRHHGLNVFQQLLRDSLSNRSSCVRAGMLDFLLDWFAQEEDNSVVLKIAMLIQVIGGHSISGKDIRKIFAILRSEKVGAQRQYRSLLLTSVQSMLNEKGPTAFFDLNGNDSGIIISVPLQWPVNKGFSFSCWLRAESFPHNGTVGLFKFLTENGRGCISVLSNDMLMYESINLKRQRVQMHVNLVRKKWHFLCITHSIGRAFSGGSLLRYYVDGDLVSSERCRYPRVSELMTSCSIATKIVFPQNDEDDASDSAPDSFPFHGQIGPVYLFSDAISSEQIKAVHSLGPSYMYSFLEKEASSLYDNPLSGESEVLDAKDGLASKIIFGLNAQASDGRKLFNVSPNNDNMSEKSSFEATIMGGSELCSRRLLQQIIYCVGGVSVFFPLITQSDRFENNENGDLGSMQLMPIVKERLAAEVIELIASILDDNLANQQQMHLLSGFLILGFLLQSVPPKQLNLETLSALKHLFNVVANCGLAELLVKDAISGIFLNPLIWLYSEYQVQRELYMFIIQQFDSDPRLLKSLCRLPRVIDMIWQFYWDNVKSPFAIGGKPLLHPVTGEVIGERPNREEVRKIRLLLLSLAEMSLRQDITAQDIKALVTFFETSQDMTSIEDLLHMVIRAISQKSVLASFLEQVNGIGGCHIFVNLLQREYEPVRLLGLQFLGRLVVGFPAEKKGPKFFNIAVGRSKLQPENTKKNCSRMQPIFAAMSDRLFNFQLTDNFCATMFDVLLGGASPKQVLQRQMQIEKQKNKETNSHFVVPRILVLIFRYLYSIDNAAARIKIMSDLLELLDSNPLNIEALMEYGWNAWLSASLKLDVVKNYMPESIIHDDDEVNEQRFVRSIFCVVLSHYVLSVKGGWQYLEETSNFLLLHSQQGSIACWHLLRDIYDDLIQRLVDFSSEENIFVSQPCRDNTLYFLRLVDEMLISEIDSKLLFPVNCSECPSEVLEVDSLKDYASAVTEIMGGEFDDKVSRNPWAPMQPVTDELNVIDDKWWNLFDNVWLIISEMNGKGPSKMLRKSSSSVGPSIGQRARGLVESLNIPAAEMAAVVVSGGIGNALGGKSNKNIDRAMVLRGDRCPRIVFRLVVLYLCRSSLERASRCVQQVISVLPSLLTPDDEQSKSRLQLFIWFLLTIRSTYGGLDDGARIHVIAHLIRETVNCGKSVLATSMVGRDESDTASNSKDTGSMYNLIQKDRVLTAVSEEAKYLKSLKSDRERQLQEFRDRMDEKFSLEFNNKKAFEEEAQNLLHAIHASDESRRTSFLLSQEEEHQNVTEKWMHVFRALIDERGPWSANPFPSRLSIHWKLDKTEDTWRRRPKLRRNYHFDKKLCLPPSNTPSDEAAQYESKAGLVGQIPEQMKRFLLKGVRRITDEGSSDPPETDAEQSGQKSVSDEPSESSCMPAVKSSNDLKDLRHDRKEFSQSSQEAETSEVLISVPCVLVSSKRKLAGRLAVMKDVLHFFGQFLVEGTGGSSVFKDLSVSSNFESAKADQKQKFLKWPFNLDMSNEKGISQDDIDAESLGKTQLKNFKRYRRWHMAKVKAVHWTRYLLRYTSIEVFFCDSVAPIFLNFPTQKDAKEVGKLIVATRNELLFPKGSSRDKSGVIQFVDRYIALEMAETARERWRRREITNFEYLMILNTLAGRSYNDLTQYPVFPWVLADYSSEVLDFNKSSTFRDLSKPVGALDSKRFEVFEERYCNFCDPDIPSFYYGSHYSSMGIVLYYLLRLEPFTSLHRNLQGGKFDHADRLFQSIEATYRNCLSNTSDVKELIPEFFYMPEFLVNSNSYYFGVKQDGEPIADVSLPTWAKGSPELFVTINREALESEYVSSNLHQWIDLVFGYKQRGKPAVEAANIFYYLTYEGAVDLDTMDDDLQRSAIEDQIANFGQTPIQIFRKKHPRRGPPIPIAHPLYFAPDSINLTSIVPCASHTPSPVLYIHVLDSSIVLVNEGLTLSVKLWVTTQLQSGGNFTFSGSQDPFFGVGSDILSPRKIGSPLVGNVVLGSQCFATLHTPSENFLISCGNWENSFQIISLNDGRMVQSIRQHKDVVSCVAAEGSFVATGSYDTTVMVWECIRVKPYDKRVRNAQSEAPRKDYVIVETPFHILCGHDDIVTCLYISVELDVVISGSKDGTCIFHSLRDGRYVRSLRHPSGYALSKLIASHHGHIVLYADDDLSLHLYSINGKHLASSESNGRLRCVELSKCGEFLVSAGDQGQIVVRSMNTLEVVKKYNGVGKIITSLTVTLEECFIAGTKDGVLLVYSIENPQSRRNNPRNVKYKASVAN